MRASLDAIVGTWQSDTTDGISARSVCAPSPSGSAVVCEQRIATPRGEQRAVNVFVVDSAHARIAYFGITEPGAGVRPAPVTIVGRVWTYGGLVQQDDGMFYRTINDFSRWDKYTWRQESSRDGVTWLVGQRGRVRRVR